MAGLSKSRIIAHRQCPKRLWLQTHRKDLAEAMPFSAMAERAFAAGHDVGEIACSQVSGGLMLPDDKVEAAKMTAALLGQKQKRVPLFEATFVHEEVLTRSDLLLPLKQGWRMREVKSSTKLKDYHLEDAAVQTWVMRGSGLDLRKIELAHVDNEFVYPGEGDYAGLLVAEDVTEAVAALQAEVPEWVAAAKATVRRRKEPEVVPGPQCTQPFECPFCAYCIPEPAEEYPVECLPRNRARELAQQLRAEGFGDLRQVPAERMDNDILIRIHKATKTGKPFLDLDATRAALGDLPFPRYYIDFETINPAVPIWAGTRPYQQVPFQWSCHVEHQSGEVEHHAFLADGSVDPRRSFIESLVKVLRKRGAIFVYHAAFETGRLKEIAVDFPEFAHAVAAILDRIVDLLPLARNHYYHRDQMGSWSIKAVLPTIAPELSYEGMPVADGGMAMEAYYEILEPQTSTERALALRDQLLAYCERDTLAMVRIAHHFQGV